MARKPAIPPEPGEGKMDIASVKHVAPTDIELLQKQVADLTAKLEIETAARSAAEQKALEKAEEQAGSLMQSQIQEVPTGKQMEIARCIGYETVSYKDDGRPILKPKFERYKVPTFFYKIDLPPIGGVGLNMNGQYLYHGTVYEMDVDTLRTVKDSVYKAWKHEADIHGSDENMYRRPSNVTLRGGQVRTGI